MKVIEKFGVKIAPSGVFFESDGIILEDAIKNSIVLEHSCKTGDCGICVAEVISGVVENEVGEVVTSGNVLVCKSKALAETELKVNYYPELSRIKLQTLPCKVANIEYTKCGVAILKFRFPPTARFDFLPGQYIELSYRGIKRSYSLANTINADNEIELHISKVPNGKMSEHIFGDLEKGQLMRIEGPKGTFFVRDDNKPLIFVATGTGIAPVNAMVKQLLDNQDKRDIHIYWGVQTSNGVYSDALKILADKYKHIKCTLVFSREQCSRGFQGYVQDAVLRDFESLYGYQVYACGSPSMIEAARKDFERSGLSSVEFFSDAFTAAK